MRMLAVVLLVGLATPAAAQLRAGGSRRDVTPDLQKHAPVYVPGFGNNRVATGVHDPLSARCVALEAGRLVVICGVDSIGLFIDDVRRIRTLAGPRLPKGAALIVAATHDHEAVDTMGLWGPRPGVSGINEVYSTFLIEQTAEAAVEAARALKPARARFLTTRFPGIERHFDDSRPPVVHDADIVAVSLEASNGVPIATLVNWASHPEALGSRNTLITSDWPHYLYRTIESARAGVTVFVNGAIGGMQSPLGAQLTDPATGKPQPDSTFEFAELVGERVGRAVLDALPSAKLAAVTAVSYDEALVRIPVGNQGYIAAAKAGVFKGRKQFTANGMTETLVGLFMLSAGGRPVLQAALVPGELYPELSVGGIVRDPGADFPAAPLEPAVKPLMKAPFRMLFGLANDEIGYIIPKAQWDDTAPYTFGASKRWYGEVNSVGPEAAPVIIEALARLLSRQ